MPDPHAAADWTFLWLALVAYGASLLYGIASRVGRHPEPLRSLTRIHLAHLPLYLAASLWFLYGSERQLTDLAVGLYCYLALHYAFAFHVVGQALRGFSLGLCLAASQLAGRLDGAAAPSLRLEDVAAAYGQGSGAEELGRDRLRVLVESGALRRAGDRLTLTPFGRFAVLSNRLLLGLWGRTYLA